MISIAQVPLQTDVHANQYTSPTYLSEQISYFSSEFLIKIVAPVILGLIIYAIGVYDFCTEEKNVEFCGPNL